MNTRIALSLERRIAAMSADEKLIEAGRKMVRDGIVAVPGFPDAKVNLFDDWAVNPFASRSWQWAIAAFRFVPGLMAYHAASGDETALATALDGLRSWERAVAGTLRNYEFARHDHATASQAESLVFLFGYLHLRSLHEEGQARIAETLHRHADLLSQDGFYSRHTNHGIEQCRVLAMIADLFPEDPRSKVRMDLAMERLGEELVFAFGKEGVHVENSPGYHCYACLSFLKILGYFPRSAILPLAERIDAVMPKAMQFLTHVVRPDGNLPTIGDTFSVKAPNHFKRYARTQAYKHLCYALSDGGEGNEPQETVGFFPQAGYFTARDRWYPQGMGTEAFHLVFRCGFRSMYHRHDDDLSLVLYCGEDWLLDSGPYNYSEQTPLRRYLRSKWAHNVPVIMTPKANRWGLSAPPMALPMIRLPSSEGSTAVRGISHSYPDHVATRDVSVDAPRREFTVVDSLVQAKPLGRKQYLSLWHIPSDKEITIGDQTVTVLSKATGRCMVIDVIGRRCKSIALLDPGIDAFDGPRISRAMNESEPCQLLAFEWAGQGMQVSLRFRVIDAGEQP